MQRSTSHARLHAKKINGACLSHALNIVINSMHANLSHAPCCKPAGVRRASMQDKENQRHAGERILQQQKPVQIKEV
jgi:hypothetical protein